MTNYKNTYQGTDSGTSGITLFGDASGLTVLGTGVSVKKEKGMPIKIFFKLMKKKMGIIKDYKYKKMIEKAELAVKKAEEDGQIAFSEDLAKQCLVLAKEAEIYAHGIKMFLNKEIFDEFRHKTAKTVSLTKISNYSRPIPKNVLEEKKKVNNLFDSFEIMHYDDNKTVKETEKEATERREKDPILFGRIEYSDRLYFIADWEDEYCDLTLDDIINEMDLKEKEISLNKSKIKL